MGFAGKAIFGCAAVLATGFILSCELFPASPGGSSTDKDDEEAPVAKPTIVELRAGRNFAVYRTSAGDVYSAYVDFQYGARVITRKVAGLARASMVAAGGFHSTVGQYDAIALDSNGQIYTVDIDIVSGLPDSALLFTGMSSFGSTRIVEIAGGGDNIGFYYAVGASGNVWGWGSNVAYELGDSTTVHCAAPGLIERLPASVTKVAAGVSHGLALTSAGVVYQWGTVSQAAGEVHPVPQAVAAATPAQTIDGGGSYCIAVRRDGAVYVWGHLAAGTVSGISSPVAISAGAETYFPPMFVASDGTLFRSSLTGAPVSELAAELVAYRFSLVDAALRAFYVTRDGKLLVQVSFQTAPIVVEDPLK